MGGRDPIPGHRSWPTGSRWLGLLVHHGARRLQWRRVRCVGQVGRSRPLLRLLRQRQQAQQPVHHGRAERRTAVLRPRQRRHHASPGRVSARLPEQTVSDQGQDRVLQQRLDRALPRRHEQQPERVRDVSARRERRPAEARLLRGVCRHRWTGRRPRRLPLPHHLPPAVRPADRWSTAPRTRRGQRQADDGVRTVPEEVGAAEGGVPQGAPRIGGE